MPYKFSLVALGGTFDLIHDGHLALLSKAFEIGKNIIIGVSSDEFAFSKGKGKLWNNYDSRVINLKLEIKEKFGDVNYSIVQLNNDFGPTVTEGSVDAIVVSEETKQKVDVLNEIREKKGLDPIKIFVVNMIKSQDGGKLSSTRIRKGEVDRNGKIIEH